MPVTLSVKSGPATISANNTVTITGGGTVILAANQAGNANYNAAPEVTTSFEVLNGPQTIGIFASIGNKAFGDAPFVVTRPVASSKLPVTLKVKSGPATISGNTVTLTGVGTVVIAASQLGNAYYAAAPEVTMSFKVSKGAQTIGIFASIGNKALGDAPFVVTRPVASSKLPVTLKVKSGPATISGNTVTLTGVGTVVIAANQPGNGYYNAAPEVANSFKVGKALTKAPQVVNFPPVGDLLLSRGAITLSASASSGLPVDFSVISGPATIKGSSLTLIGSGNVTIRASQAGNGNYLPASTSITFNIKPNTSAPTLVSLSKSWFYYNAQPNTVVAELNAADPDPRDRVTYRLVSGKGSNDNGKFTLIDGVLRTATNFDLNIQRSASVRIRASDLLGQYRDQIFELTLVDPNPWAAFELKALPFTESPSYVNVVFQLRDQNRRRINLPQELLDQNGGWFVVSEDGKQITSKESILQVARNEVPLKVRTVLLLDNSNSVGADLETIKSAAKTFVDRMFQTQEIAIYSFSGGPPNLVKNFTAKSAAGQRSLKSAIDGIKLGSPSTNLYGSVLAMLQLPKWKESFTLAGIETGCLVVMTDGDDTAGLATLSEAISKRNADKKQIFAVGLGEDIDPAALNSLQNGDSSYTPVLNPAQLAEAFTKIQSIIEDGANNFYWINYASPKRGNFKRNLTVALKNNINTGANRAISTEFSSNGFFDITPGVVINRKVNVASGVESLSLQKNSKITANAFTMLGYKGVPVYTWSVTNAALASVVSIGSDGAQANIVSKGLDGATKLTLTDKVNGFTKTIDLVIGTGVAPVSKTASFVQVAGSGVLNSPDSGPAMGVLSPKLGSYSAAAPSAGTGADSDPFAASLGSWYRTASSSPASLEGKVLVSYWGSDYSNFEYHYFKTNGLLIFKDKEEHSKNKYIWNQSTGVMRDLTFEERFKYDFESSMNGSFSFYDGSVKPTARGSFVIYDASWDLDGNGKADGEDIQLGKMPGIKHPLNLASDEDKDGLDLAAEGQAGTNPKKKDSDGDQFSDGDEVLFRKTNPKAFNDGIVSSLSKMILVMNKLMPKYAITSNFGARDFTVTNLPPGLKYSKTTGVISGIPNKKGTYSVSITARKMQGGKAVKTAKATKDFVVK